MITEEEKRCFERKTIFWEWDSILVISRKFWRALWKPPSTSDKPKDTNGTSTDKSLSGADKKIDAMDEKNALFWL